MNEFGLSERTFKYIKNFFKQFDEVDKVVIYGSRARGDFSRSSDIDLMLYSKTKLDFIELGYMKESLEAFPIMHSVDISDYNSITNQDFKDEIDKDGKIIYEKL